MDITLLALPLPPTAPHHSLHPLRLKDLRSTLLQDKLGPRPTRRAAAWFITVPNPPSCLPCLLATMANLPQHSTMHLSFSSAPKHLQPLLLPLTTINKHTCPPSTLP